MVPLGADISAVGNEAGILAPAAGRGLPILIGLNGSLLHGIEGGERHKILDVGAGRGEDELEGGGVLGGHVQLIGIAREAGEHIAIVSCGGGGGGALPRILKVGGGQVGAVGPLQALAQGDSVGQAVIGYGVAGGAGGNGVALCVVGVKAGEGVGCQAGAVNGAVEGGIQEVRLGGQVQTQGVGAVAHGSVHEELGLEEVGVDAVHIVLLHIQVVVIVEGQYAVVGHEDILGLVHELGTLCVVGLSLYLGDQVVVLGPVGSGVDEGVAYQRSSVRIFCGGGSLLGSGGLAGSFSSRAGAGSKYAAAHHSDEKQCEYFFHGYSSIFFI